MIEIKDLLLNFNNLLVSEETKRESVRAAVSEAIKTEVSLKDVKIQKGTVFLNIKPIYKSEVFLKREEILSKIEKSLGRKSPHNIR